MGLSEMDASAPNWILDRRGSGYLYWRREPKELNKRVKFRCDVEVMEFWPSEEEWIDSREEIKCRAEEMPPPSALVGALCLCAIIATVGYNWLFPVP